MKIRSLWLTLPAIVGLVVALPAPASAASDPAEPTFTITGTTDSSVSIEWVDHSTDEVGFIVQLRRADTDWKDALDLRDQRAGQPQATGWTYTQKFNTPVSPQVRAVCLRVKAYNGSGSSDWTPYQCTKPDLIVSALSVPFSNAHSLPFNVGFGACNLSNVETGRHSVQVSVLARESRNFVMPSLAPRDCYFHTVQMGGLPAGSYSVSVHLDSLGEVDEAFENNNVSSLPLIVT